MNEQIKQLVKQAGFVLWKDENWNPGDIVKECDRYVAEHYDEYEPYIKPGDLLKHFGVEE
jgi:hypothetical protein